MKSLGSALHEVSTEAREAKENLLHIQPESESYDAHIEDLKLVLKSTNEKYNSMLDEAEWEQREVQLVSCIKKNEEENVSLEKEIKILLYLLKETEEEANAKREEKAQLKEKLKEVEAEAIQLKEALKETTTDNMELKENLLDKENYFTFVAIDALYDIGTGLEVLSPWCPHLFLEMAGLGNFAKGMAVVAARATRLPIYSSFSKEGNLSDLFAKEEEFSTLFNVIGIGVGIQLASTICASM
ncbi:hypothetical protein JHK85_006687 [Glycine max]|nr:hypothetical protein JHK85_006687 [Glycine max]